MNTPGPSISRYAINGNQGRKMSHTKSRNLNQSNICETILLSFLILIMCSCTGPSVRHRQYVSDYEPKAPGTPIDVFMEREGVRDDYKVIGVVSIGDTGLSINCDWIDVLEIAKEKARNAGGDAIQLTSVKSPDISSTCYRITANILKIGKTKRKWKIATGTGFAVRSNGLIVTAYHLIENVSKIEVKFSDGDWLPAKLIRQSRNTDIAILKIAANPPAILPLKSTKTLRAGDSVFTMGYPVVELLGTEAKYTDGKISSLTGIKGEDSLIQVTVPIQPGNSGGPLVNSNGEVIGLITSTAAVKYFFAITETLPQNINWAVKSDYIIPMLDLNERIDTGAQVKDPVGRVTKAVCIVKTE